MEDHMATSTPTTRRDPKHVARLVVFAVAVVLLVWFVIGNAHTVNVEFWVTSAQTSLIAVILISAALGALISLVMVRRKR